MSTSEQATPGRQHVEILTTIPSSDRRRDNDHGYGSGYVIAPDLVLTARHVLDHAITIKVRLGTEPCGSCLPATIVWLGTAGVDLAILRLQEPVPYSVRTPSFGQLLALPEIESTERSWTYRCTGFPKVQKKKLPDGRPYRDSATMRGHIRLDWSLRTRLLTLAAEAIEGVTAADWKGMSGCPVFVHDWLVGVVSHATRFELSAVPIAAALDGYIVNRREFIEPPESRERLRSLLVEHGVPTELQPAHRQPYRHILALVSQQCRRLRDREPELSRLDDWIRSHRPYAVWVGKPWSGKTSLAAALASNPPPGVDVVSYFVSRARGADSVRGLFTSLADQLAGLLDERVQTRDNLFDELFSRTAAMQQHLRRRLLIVVDGIDELESRTAIHNLLTRLPAEAPDTVSILLFTRQTINLSGSADPRHAINNDETRDLVELSSSRHAEQLLSRAMADVDELLEVGGISRSALECIAAVGPLAEGDLVRVLDIKDDSVLDLLHRALTTGASGRMLMPIPGTHTAQFAFTHDKLREAILQHSGARRISYQQAAARLGDHHAATGWDDITPDFFTQHYMTMLADLGDLTRLADTALSPRWLALHQRRTKTGIDAVTALRQALAKYAENHDLDLSVMVRLGLRLHEIKPRLRKYPLALIKAWASAGQLRQARHRAQQLLDDVDRIEALTTLVRITPSNRRDEALVLLALAAQSALNFDVERTDRIRQRLHEESQRGAGPFNRPAIPEPTPGTYTKIALLLQLSPLAHQLGQLELTSDINETVWSLLAEQPDTTLPIALTLDATELGFVQGDSRHPPVMLNRLTNLDLDADAAARRNLLHQILDGHDIPLEVSERFSTSTPPDDNAVNERIASTSRDADWLTRIRTCIADGDLNDAGYLIDNFRPSAPRTVSEQALPRGPGDVATLAYQAARQHGSSALVVVEAAERFIIRKQVANDADDWQPFVGDGTRHANSHWLEEPAGTFLAQIVETMARHGQLHRALEEARTTGPRDAVDQVTAAFAIGTARAGNYTAAIRLLHVSRLNILNSLATHATARHLAATSRWRNALDVVAGRYDWDAHVTTVTAIGTAIRSGAIQAGMAVLDAHDDHPDSRIGASAAEAAEALGQIDCRHAAMALMGEVADHTCRCHTLLSLTEHADRLENPELLLSLADDAAGQVELSNRAAIWTSIAAAAVRINQPAIASDALQRAIYAAQGQDGPSERVQALTSLATRPEAGVQTDLATRLLTAALSEARSLTDKNARLQALGEIAAARYDIGDELGADDIVYELLQEDGLGRCPEELIVAAARHGRTDKASRLLRISRPHVPSLLHLNRDPASGHLSDLARTAAEARLWNDVDDLVATIAPNDQPDLLAELAVIIADDDIKRARRYLFRGLLSGVTPRILAAATHLDHRVGPEAIKWFVQAAESGEI